jgi:ribosomal protein S20
MKSPLRSVTWLLPFLLTGCFQLPFHKKHPAQARMLAPHVQPSQAIQLVDIDLPPADTVIEAYAIYNLREEEEPIPPPVRHRRPPNPNPDDAATAPEPTPPATPAVSAIGQLSSGDPGNSRQETENSIADIERRLNAINRTLSDSEQKTADHIREFLKQARAALASGDVEGANTLVAKAQVLLTELTK